MPATHYRKLLRRSVANQGRPTAGGFRSRNVSPARVASTVAFSQPNLRQCAPAGGSSAAATNQAYYQQGQLTARAVANAFGTTQPNPADFVEYASIVQQRQYARDNGGAAALEWYDMGCLAVFARDQNYVDELAVRLAARRPQ